MQKAVIYARYSSDRQNEQSIAGQVEVCQQWAKNNDTNVIDIYPDEALTGRTDKRPNFQRMIRDAKSGKFDYVIVYKIDRFARNRYDSAIYKAQLKKYGVKVISAMEHIADGPEGIILESVLEGMAEYYSANLSQNVLRGMHQKAEQGKYMGGILPLGYKIDADKNYIIDEKKAFIVKRIYELYSSGSTLREICEELNAAGHTSSTGKKFTYNSLHRILTNKKYIGIYEYLGVILTDAIPRIIDDATFEKVQKRMEHNKHSPASAKSSARFLLTGKLFCGKCGSNMVGDSGTGKNKTTHYYYSCIDRKNRHGCTKKSVRKDWIEKLITDITVNEVLTAENIKNIAKRTYDIYETERNDTSELTSLNSALRETQKVIDNIMNAIEQGIITETTKQRLMEAEERKKALLTSIAKEEIKKPIISQEQIEFYLKDIQHKVYNAEEQTEIIIDTFVNAVYLYDDRIVLTYNLKEGESLKKIEISTLEEFGYDDSRLTRKKRRF